MPRGWDWVLWPTDVVWSLFQVFGSLEPLDKGRVDSGVVQVALAETALETIVFVKKFKNAS